MKTPYWLNRLGSIKQLPNFLSCSVLFHLFLHEFFVLLRNKGMVEVWVDGIVEVGHWTAELPQHWSSVDAVE